jgi:uncharacterized protein YecE (DUF72 family)
MAASGVTPAALPVQRGTIHVGPAGWSYRDWEGIVYPAGTRDRLAYLCRYCSLLEVNSTFYRLPDPRVTAGWVRRVARFPGFLFTVKLFQGFTHRPGEAGPREREAFTAGLEPLLEAGRLGALLVQFPWSFRDGKANRKTIEGLVRDFQAFRPVIELRHGSWGRGNTAEFLDGLGSGFCAIDQPAVGDSLGMSEVVTGGVGYVRLHGRNAVNWFREGAGRDARYDYLYSAGEVEPWLRIIRRIAARVDRTFVVANNHCRGQGVVNILEILSRLESRPVEVPEPLALHYPRLEKIRLPGPGGQPSLF